MKIFSFVFFCFLLFCNASARELRVGKHHAYKTIRSALDAAKTGDRITVESGYYAEGNLVVKTTLTLTGKGFPVIDGQKKTEIITIKAPSVTVQGFKVQKSGYGSLDDPGAIKVHNTHHAVIKGNILDDNFFGIYVQFGSHCTVESNTITAYGVDEQMIGNGIHCWKSDSLLIKGNNITGHRDGIYFEFVRHSLITDNYSRKNVRYGLHFMFSHDDEYHRNTFRNNGAGVAVMFTNRVKMIDNIFEENWGDAAYGLMLKEISDSHISGNRFIRNTSGIYMEGTNRILVEKNTFEANGWGMKIQASCMDNEIRSNNFRGNTFDISTNGSLVLNTFNGNYWDKYEGYDINKDKVGDIPYRPLSLFSVIVENNPPAMLLFRSFMVTLLDKSEKILPSLTPDNFIDNSPLMKPLPL